MLRPSRTAALSVLGLLTLAAGARAQSFVNWETPHVSPLDLTPDGSRLLAVNTPDNRLEVFDSSGGALVPLFAVKVGLDPVSVRARGNAEAWVVNHVSDSVSVVDLATGRVTFTLDTDDEPCDVVFAGTPERAFVSCSQANTVLVFDPANLQAAPASLAIAGEDPRALAVSPDGQTVYAAIFESGNASTILGGGLTMGGGFPPNVVNHPAGPYGGVNPPPNSGGGFVPAQNGANPAPPGVGMIVKKDALGNWMDDNGGDWTALVSGPSAALSGRTVGWDLPDRDVAVIDAATLGVSYATGLMNLCMALAVHPTSGAVSIVGTDATNEVRFEPVLSGTFVRVKFATVAAGGAPTTGNVDLNAHLTYATSTIAQTQRDRALGDPRGLAWAADGSAGYVTGMGSNNLVKVDPSGARSGAAPTIEVGEGPTGVRVHDALARVYVLNKFEASISVVDTQTELETARVPFFDPSPQAVKLGRKHLYDTHENSGLGQVACASCHVDARMDRLSWDLGDPEGDMRTFNQNCLDGNCEDWHPMKGPMLTQTMQDIIGKEPFHWRGDRDGIEEFNGAFESLQGDDTNLTPGEMQEFEDFLATIHFPPNPFRELDNSLPASLPLPGHFTTGRFAPAGQPLPAGDAVNGLALYRPPTGLDGGLACATCHTLPTGLGTGMALQGFNLVPVPPGPNGEAHLQVVSVDGSTNVTMKTPHLRNLYDRVGFETTQTENNAGFGFLHDGSVDSLARFVSEPVFSVSSDQDVADLVAFMLAFAGSDVANAGGLLEPPGPDSQDTHAAVGKQLTVLDGTSPAPGQSALLAQFESLADACAVGLVAHGNQVGLARGFAYLGGGSYQSDRGSETLTAAQLLASAAPGSELTWTVVPKGSETRIGIDRDEDGALDRDELDAGSDPADPASLPGAYPDFCNGDGGDQAGCTDCPCSNDAAPGTVGGCLNGVGQSARLQVSGTPSLAADTLRVELTGGNPATFGVLTSGDAQAPANAANPCFGLASGVTSFALDGLRCVVQGVQRHGARPSDAAGDIGVTTNGWGPPNGPPAGLLAQGGFAAGQTKHFAAIYREDPALVCGTGQNTTQGVSVLIQP